MANKSIIKFTDQKGKVIKTVISEFFKKELIKNAESLLTPFSKVIELSQYYVRITKL